MVGCLRSVPGCLEEHSVAKRTLEQALNFSELAGIVELPKFFRLLGQILPLYGRVPLEGHDLGGGVVEVGDEGGEVEG